MSVKRFDVGSFRKATRTKQGFLKADAYATRVGIFTYRTPDGKVVKEFRSPEEVFKSDSIKSLAEITVTNDHPPEFVTAENSKIYQAGFTSEKVDKDENFVKVGITVTDAALIKEIENGKIETSCGYTCDVENIEGEYKGEKYDAVQRNIIYNHLAVVNRGRAGGDVKIRLDAIDALMIDELPELESERVTTDKGLKDKTMAKFKLDSVEFETEDTALAQAIVKKIDELENVKSEKETLQGKCDASQDEIKSLKDELEKAKSEKLDNAQIMEIARARLSLEETAKKFVSEEIKLDAMSDVEIKKEVIKSQKPELSLEEKSDAYVDGCFDIVIQAEVKKADESDKKIADAILNGAEKNDAESARLKSIEHAKNLWTKPVGKFLDKQA